MANANPIDHYLNVISKWSTSIANDNQWFIYIPFPSLGLFNNNLNNIIGRFEGNGSGSSWEITKRTFDNLTSVENQEMGDTSACVFANSITIPNESVTASNQGLQHSGFQAPATANYRNAQQVFSVKFIETNSSFIDFVMRPWTIMVGHYGFVTRADSSKNVRVPYIDVVYLGKSGAWKKSPLKRKIIRFYNAAPIKVQGISSSYSENSLKTSTIDFIYDYYSVEAVDSNRSNTNSAQETISNIPKKVDVSATSNSKTSPLGFTETSTFGVRNDFGFGFIAASTTSATKEGGFNVDTAILPTVPNTNQQTFSEYRNNTSTGNWYDSLVKKP